MAVSKRDRAEFRAFVRNASDRQLDNIIIEKEREAERRVYCNIAIAERTRRRNG